MKVGENKRVVKNKLKTLSKTGELVFKTNRINIKPDHKQLTINTMYKKTSTNSATGIRKDVL